MNFLKAVFVSTLLSTSAFAQETKHYVLADAKSPGVTFQIGYSAGVHDGTTSEMTANVTLSQKNAILKGDFKIPISQISTGNSTRDCHMREALGINYTDSKFPTDHVCDSDNQLPQTGPDSIAYPEIRFKFTNVKKDSGTELPEVLEVGKAYKVAIQGQWIIHGQTVDLAANEGTESIPVQVKLLDAETQEIQVTGKFQISLKAFNIIVKPFKIAFIQSGVADNAKVTLNTKMVLK